MSTYGSISQRTAAYASKKMLEHAEPILVIQKFADAKEVPANTADTAKWRRPVPFAPALVALTEGVTPAAGAITYVDVQMQLQQYGAWVEITDKIADVAEDPVLQNVVMLNGEQAAETCEILLFNAIKGGTNVQYANGGARNAVNTVITLNGIRKAVRTLMNNRASRVTSIIGPSVNMKTEPVEAAYIALCHTDVEADIRNLTGFIPVAQYGSQKPLCPQELGRVENVRFISSPLFASWANAGGASATMMSVGGTNADVYPVLVFGKHAYASVALKGKNAIKPMILNPGEARWGDQLGQKGSAGWKTWWAGGILNDAWIVRYEVAATKL